jgi:hypothetical protein
MIGRDERRQAFLIIDEASQYTDNSIETLLTKVRQFKLGVMLAYQHLDHKELNDNIRSALYGSTAVKFVGGAGHRDRMRLAREMETTPDFIAEQKRDSRRKPEWSQFACYVRNSTHAAVALTLPFYRLENLPKMADAAYARMMAKNQIRVSAIASPAPRATPPHETAPATGPTAPSSPTTATPSPSTNPQAPREESPTF